MSRLIKFLFVELFFIFASQPVFPIGLNNSIPRSAGSRATGFSNSVHSRVILYRTIPYCRASRKYYPMSALNLGPCFGKHINYFGFQMFEEPNMYKGTSIKFFI